MKRDSAEQAPISVLIPCFNNEDYIEECLRSVEWADEIVVVDSFSTDRTVAIAQRYAQRVLQHEYLNSAAQKNWCIPQLTHEWVLIVDTDERVPEGLRREIENAVNHPGGFTGYRIARRNVVFGRWLRHGGYWPDYQTRLFRRDRGVYQERLVHADVILNGPCGTLTTPLQHYPHRSLAAMRAILLSRYSSWEARQKLAEGVRFRPSQLLTRPLGAFAARAFLKMGVLDGWQGWLISSVWAWYVLITYWKLGALTRERDRACRQQSGTGLKT